MSEPGLIPFVQRLIQLIHLKNEPLGNKPIFSCGRYRNPWSTWDDPDLLMLFRHLFMTRNANIPSDEEELARTLPVLRPDLTQFSTSPAEGVRFMWIGQSSSLVQFDGFTLLTDPIFSDRCSPSQWIGPRRYRPPPCSINQLPMIDCVLISHDHYDNLDYSTVLALNKRYGRALRWYVPMGLKSWMESSGCQNVVELTWWNEYVHSEASNIKIVCTPCQHWCKRGIFDANKVLWTSWCVIGPKNRFFFVGDTGYCPAFEEIGCRYGPFTLSALPIGAYEPRWFFSSQHVHPSEAVQIHKDVRSETSIGIDWGTFALASKEFYLDPRNKLQKAVKDQGMNPQCFVTVKHGEIIVVKSQHHTSISDSS